MTAGLRVCIHRGAKEIGGNCVEFEASGKRLVVDIGRPLSAVPGSPMQVPRVTGTADKALIGVVLSHPHQDHYGLVGEVDPDIPLYVGKEAAAILEAAAFFTPSGVRLKPAAFLSDHVPLRLGPFVITPYLVDHSAFDSYALLIEANGRRVFYSGDFRAHGRKSRFADRLRREPPRPVDVLLLEGTHVRGDGARPKVSSEREVEQAMAEVFRNTQGLAVIFSATQNIDRLVTIYRACKRAGRTLVIDLYTACVAAAIGRRTIPQPGFPNLRVYVPNSQRILVKQSGQFERIEQIKRQRIFLDEVAAAPHQFAMLLQGSTLAEVARSDSLKGAVAIWSLWMGYLDNISGRRIARILNENGVSMTHLHASGHAGIKDLQALAAAIAPARVVPIHSAAPERFAGLFANVEQHDDGEWWAA